MFICKYVKHVLLLLGDTFNSCHGHLSLSTNQQDSEDGIKWSASWSLLICLMCALSSGVIEIFNTPAKCDKPSEVRGTCTVQLQTTKNKDLQTRYTNPSVVK